MTLPTWDDIEVYLEDLGVDAVYTNSAGLSRDIKVIFDRENSDMTIGSVDIQSALPQARAKTADVEDVNNSATLVIDSVTYYVKDSNPDATGMTLLILSRDRTN
jgi:hypothetical protein